jgi:hypothetical protein
LGEIIFELQTKNNHFKLLVMEKIILSFAICLYAFQTSHAQVLKDSIRANRIHENELSTKFNEKGKMLETTGFVLIGAGMAATIGGFYGAMNNYDLFTGAGSGYVILWAVGVAAFSTGIPVLINGFHYKRKAHLVLRNDNISRSFHVPVKANVFSVGIAFSIK